MKRADGVAFLFVFLFASVLHAGELPWHSVPDTAMAVARGQQKMLLVHYRSACANRCNDKLDAAFEAAAADDVFMHALDSYIPLRVTARVDGMEHSMFASLAKIKVDKPLIAVYDATGVLLSIIDRKVPWEQTVEEILGLRGQRRVIVRSVEMRSAGRISDADMMAGNALLNAGVFWTAADRLERAAKQYREEKSEELAQIAEVQAGGAWYLAGSKPRGRKTILEIAKNPFSKAVAAEASMMAGALHEADARRAGPRLDGLGRPRQTSLVDERLMEKAIAAYRKAYETAEPGTTALHHSRSALARLDDQPLPHRKSETEAVLRMVVPARALLIGDSEFHVESTGNLSEVEYYLDNLKVASSTKPPFRVTIDVGHVPSARTVKAVAFDRSGNPASEATVTINDRTDAFLVSIVAPAAAWIGGASDVELDVRVPPGRKLSRVDVSWNGKDVATLTAKPLRTRIDVPRNEFGYLRAVATLDDGSSAESTKVYNSAGVSESLEVGNVTVIATVNDDKGERIAGLTSKNFSIRDEGEAVRPELKSTDEDPVTIGIAIDSSSSMSGRQLYVIRAATQFLGRALRPQDQAFVVSFDTGARLVHRRSNDSASLREAVYSLSPRGGTSIFDGVTFALQQFQGITGKKALVVFSDGAEGTSSASARECERLARAVGVPLYVVVPPAAYRHKNALFAISGLTGGTMFYGEPVESFPAMFDRLAAEMRGQYVLSFTRPAGIRTGAWRSIRVSVDRRDANVRSIQGYRAN